MNKVGMVAVLLMLPFTGCLGGDECGWMTDTTKSVLDEDEAFSWHLGERVSEIKYWWDRHDDEGHEIDIYVMDNFNHQKYTSDSSFSYIPSLSNPATTSDDFDKSDYINEDDFWLVIDNTNRGDSSPPSDGVNNIVEFTVYVEVYKCNA